MRATRRKSKVTLPADELLLNLSADDFCARHASVYPPATIVILHKQLAATRPASWRCKKFSKEPGESGPAYNGKVVPGGGSFAFWDAV